MADSDTTNSPPTQAPVTPIPATSMPVVVAKSNSALIQTLFTESLEKIGPQQLLSMLVLLSAVLAIAVGIGIWMWGQETVRESDYQVLFSNLSDRDGGAIIESLQQQNIHYKLVEGGGALMVLADRVHEIRLRLASQGLPKGGTTGFELMENQKFGTSQFLEQVNYQRSLEGELARSIQTLGPVLSARVHLAIPKPSVFVKEQQKPTASVILTLHPGRALDVGQVNAIMHLVSSSIPNLPSKSVTVLDQRGSLLSSLQEDGTDKMNASQLKYVHQIEQDYIKRIGDILTPLIGEQNVRVQVTADIDFSQSEQTEESYKPNQPPNQSSIRSSQTTESRNNALTPAGVPGALSNQPPAPATAQIVIPADAITAAQGEHLSSHKEATTNYEVDRMISHTKLHVGNIKRLSVAVLINNRSVTDAEGKITSKAFTPAEQIALNNLIRNAMGFNAQRGDSLNLLNSEFNEVVEAAEAEIPLWKQPEMIEHAKTILKYLLITGLALYFYLAIIRPAYRNLVTSLIPPPPEVVLPPEIDHEAESAKEKEFALKKAEASYESSIQAAKKISLEQPKIVASVVQEWMETE